MPTNKPTLAMTSNPPYRILNGAVASILRTGKAFCLVGVVAMSTSAALGQTVEALQTKSLAATCANCHGTNGKATEGSAVTGLAGLSADYTIAQMNAFKTGTRPATIMHQISKGYSDTQIAQIAAYFAAQKK